MSDDPNLNPINGPRRPALLPRQRLQLPPPSSLTPSFRDAGAHTSPDCINAQSRTEDGEDDEDDDDTIDNHHQQSRLGGPSAGAEAELGVGRPLRPLPPAPWMTPSTTPITNTPSPTQPGIPQGSSNPPPRVMPTPPRAQPPVPGSPVAPLTPRREAGPAFRPTGLSVSNNSGYPSPSGEEHGPNPSSPQGSSPPPYSFENEQPVSTPSPAGRLNHNNAPYSTSPSMSPSFNQPHGAQYIPPPSMSPSVNQLTSAQSASSPSISSSYSSAVQNSPVTSMSPSFSHSSSAQYSPLSSMSPSTHRLANAYGPTFSSPLATTALNDIRTGGRVTEAAFDGVPPQGRWNTMLRRPEDGGHPAETGSAMQYGQIEGPPPHSPNRPLVPNRRNPLHTDLVARSSPVSQSPLSSAYGGSQGDQSLAPPPQPSPVPPLHPYANCIVLANGDLVNAQYVEDLQTELDELKGLLREAKTANADIIEDYTKAGRVLDMIYTGGALDDLQPRVSSNVPCEMEDFEVVIKSKCSFTNTAHDGPGSCTRPAWRGTLALREIEFEDGDGFYKELWQRAKTDVHSHLKSKIAEHVQACKKPWRRPYPNTGNRPLPLVGPLSHQGIPPWQ